MHLRPDARGSVSLKSPDPLAAPSIRFNFLKTRYDIEALTAGMRLARNITQQPALARMSPRRCCRAPRSPSDAEFEATIRRNGISNLHPVGTCRMGADPQAVCDPRLKVNGIAGLRVVDALGDAERAGRQHQRPDDHDRREGLDMILEDARAA